MTKDFSNIFIDTIKDINKNGNEGQPRELKVKEKFFSDLTINPTLPIAHFRARPFNWKYFAGELAWYLKRDNNINYINHFSKFWSNITNPGTNEINSNYGSLVIGEQLEWVIKSLRDDKNTRQAIAFFNRPQFQFEGNKDFVCTMYANFFIRNNKLNMKVQMRSNDVFYGLTFDAPFFAFLQQSVYQCLLDLYPDLELGNYHHFADNIHFYERHFDLADKIMTSTAKNKIYSLKIKKPFICWDNNKIKYTRVTADYIDDIDSVIGQKLKSESYKNILSNYFVLNQ
jgi:thymidylate synthase